jgi:hypothetical protein
MGIANFQTNPNQISWLISPFIPMKSDEISLNPIKYHIPKVRSPPIAVPNVSKSRPRVREENPAPEHTIEVRPSSPHHLSSDIGCLLPSGYLT